MDQPCFAADNQDYFRQDGVVVDVNAAYEGGKILPEMLDYLVGVDIFYKDGFPAGFLPHDDL